MKKVNVELVVNGQKHHAYLTKAEWEELQKKMVKHTGYERVPMNHDYYYVDEASEVQVDKDLRKDIDDRSYEIANYYTNKQLAQDCARADTIMRRLRRFAAEVNDDAIKWNNFIKKYSVAYHPKLCNLEVCETAYYKIPGAIYFDTHEKARQAIEKFRDDLIWYCTEYQERLKTEEV